MTEEQNLSKVEYNNEIDRMAAEALRRSIVIADFRKRNAPVPNTGPLRARADHPIFAGPPPDARQVTPWFSIKAAVKAEEATEIFIYGQIGKNWYGDGIDGKTIAEELKKIPRGQKIKVRVNSNGGNVVDGLAVYNLLNERKADVTTKVDGVAASIASVIVLAGSKVEMPKTAMFMIHNPWTYAEGNANDFRQLAEKLDIHRDAICSAYEKKTGKEKKELCRMMDEETWMTGDGALEQGFVDAVTDEEITFQACAEFDFSKFKHVPDHLKQPQAKGTTMKRKQIIARLKQLGVKFNDSATDAELQALLTQAETRAQDGDASGDNNDDTQASDQDSDTEEGEDAEGDTDGDDADEGVQGAVEDESSTPRARTKRRSSLPDPLAIARITRDHEKILAELKTERKKRDAEKEKRVRMQVQECIAQDRIPAAQEDRWVKRIMADESVLDDLRSMEPRPPGAPPIGAVITSDDPKAIQSGFLATRAALASFLKGNDVDSKVLAENSIQLSRIITANRKKLEGVLAANTIDPVLKRNVIMNDLMRAFKRKLLNLNVFVTRFTNVPLQGTNKIALPFYELDTTASTNFNSAVGYTFAEDTTVGSRDVTVNKRKYKTMDFSSETFRRQPYFRPDVHIQLKAEQLGVDVWTDILSIVTASNYGSSVMNIEAGQFDTDDMIELRRIANNADWPDMGRAAVLGTDFEAALLSDDALKHFMNSNSTAALREGATGRLLDFDLYYSPRIPENSEDLGGFICLPQAALVATAPIAPAPGVRQQLLAYDQVTDPDTGITFEYRYGSDVWMDKDREVIECNYGYEKGNNYALKRITKGSNEYSSSSSQSSVNSASSSSSSPSF